MANDDNANPRTVSYIACSSSVFNHWNLMLNAEIRLHCTLSLRYVTAEKPFVKLRPAYSVKLVFSYVVKGIKIKITAQFRASRRFRFEDTK